MNHRPQFSPSSFKPAIVTVPVAPVERQHYTVTLTDGVSVTTVKAMTKAEAYAYATATYPAGRRPMSASIVVATAPVTPAAVPMLAVWPPLNMRAVTEVPAWFLAKLAADRQAAAVERMSATMTAKIAELVANKAEQAMLDAELAEPELLSTPFVGTSGWVIDEFDPESGRDFGDWLANDTEAERLAEISPEAAAEAMAQATRALRQQQLVAAEMAFDAIEELMAV